MITIEEWLAELQSTELQPEGFSTEEIATKTGRTNGWVRDRIREGVRKGSIIFAGRRLSHMMDGRPFWVPVYKFKDNSSVQIHSLPEVKAETD